MLHNACDATLLRRASGNGVSKMRKSALWLAATFILALAAAEADEADKPSLTTASVIVKNARVRPSHSVLSDVEIEFDITNASKIVFKAVVMHGVLQTPGRALPWIEADIGYRFPGGLEPGESKHLRLTPGLMSDWRHVDAAWLKTGVLTLTPSEVEDSADSKFSVQK